MFKKILGMFLLGCIAFRFLDCSENKCEPFVVVQQEYQGCLDCLDHSNMYINTIADSISKLPIQKYYDGLEHMCSNADNIKQYIDKRLDCIVSCYKILKKQTNCFDEQQQKEIKQTYKDIKSRLKSFLDVVDKHQRQYLYCDKCQSRPFDYYNIDTIVIDGYQYLENIPQMNYFVQGKTDKQLVGQLSNVQKHYLNLVHYKHHQLQDEGVYQYVQGLGPIVIDKQFLKNLPYKLENVKISKWDLLHVFMGDIKGEHLAGVHLEDKNLFKDFYELNHNSSNNVTVRNNQKYKKASTFFDVSWDMKACVKKVYEALEHITDVEPGDKHGICNIVVHGKTKDGFKIAVVIDPAKELVISFYPE